MTPSRHTHSVRQVADHLNVHPSTICRWTSERPGFPQPLRLSRKIVRYDLEEIERYLSEYGQGCRAQ